MSHGSYSISSQPRFTVSKPSNLGLPGSSNAMQVVPQPTFQTQAPFQNQYQNQHQNQPQEVNGQPSPAPPCPKCNALMVFRTTKQGPNIGKTFWGCSTQNCKGFKAIDTFVRRSPLGNSEELTNLMAEVASLHVTINQLADWVSASLVDRDVIISRLQEEIAELRENKIVGTD
jgi:hypothetical protein